MGVTNFGSASTNSLPLDPENDREFKAHVYQQLVDLQPYLAPESQIAVLIQHDEDEPEENDEVALTLVATLGEYKIESEGRDENLYEAFGIAKKRMIEQLEELYAVAVDSSERDAQIQSLIEGRHLVH